MKPIHCQQLKSATLGFCGPAVTYLKRSESELFNQQRTICKTIKMNSGIDLTDLKNAPSFFLIPILTNLCRKNLCTYLISGRAGPVTWSPMSQQVPGQGRGENVWQWLAKPGSGDITHRLTMTHPLLTLPSLPCSLRWLTQGSHITSPDCSSLKKGEYTNISYTG